MGEAYLNEGCCSQTCPGGVPIATADGVVIGSIGVSGDTVEKDHGVAMAGAQAVAR